MVTTLGKSGIPAILISDAAVFAMMPMITKVMLSTCVISYALYTGEWWAYSIQWVSDGLHGGQIVFSSSDSGRGSI